MLLLPKGLSKGKGDSNAMYLEDNTSVDALLTSPHLPSLLETLPGALFVVDDTETIVYANTRAQVMAGAISEACIGNSFWRSAPQLVSPALFQALRKTKQSREATAVAYRSPVTQCWLHVSLSCTDEGIVLFFQDYLEPLPLQNALSYNEQMYRELLESLADGVTILTPDGLVLDINQRALADAYLPWE